MPILSISPYTSYILSCDAQAFSPKSTEPLPLSTLVNKIIVNYAEKAEITNRKKLNLTEQELENLLSAIGITINEKNIQMFRNAQQNNTSKIKKPYNPVRLRPILDNAANRVLSGIESNPRFQAVCKTYRYSNAFSKPKFISALLEEYAELPFDKRESLYFSDHIEKLNDAIEYNKKNYRFPKFFSIKRNSSNECSTICPLEIRSDEWSTHSYLLGVSLSPHSPNGYKFVSLRLSGIEQINNSTEGSIFVPGIDTKDLYSRLYKLIERKGVMFVSSETDEPIIYLSLTAAGWQNYCNIVFLRPKYDSISINKDGGCTMKFSCSQRQILYYFLKLGKNVKIEEPKSLRTQFETFYSEAQKIYIDEN